MLTHNRLRELFSYDPETGTFTRLVRTSANAPKGQTIVGAKSYKYLAIAVDKKLYYAHRLAWLYVHGEFPAKGMDIDHINEDKHDNRIANLRIVSRAENMRNRRAANSGSASGVRGVHFCNLYKKWVAHVTVNYKYINLGYFDTLSAAIEARAAGERKYFRRAG